MHSIIKSSITAVIIMMFTACGGGGGGEVSTPTITGAFVKSVAGLNYTCFYINNDRTSSGITNSLGEYTCEVNQQVKFSLGSYEIGSCEAAEKRISVYTLYPSNNTAAINVAQLLETIDDDNNNSNGITIPDGFIKLDSVTVRPTDPLFDDTIEVALAEALIDGPTAKENLNEVLGLPYEGIGFTAAWLEGKILYTASKDTLDSNHDDNDLDWILTAIKYESGVRSLDFLADGFFEDTSGTFVINNSGVLEITDGADFITITMIEVDEIKIKVTMSVNGGPDETLYEYIDKSAAEDYVTIRSYPCSCGYFTNTFLEGNTLYSVVLDTQDYDNDNNTAEQIMIASKYESGIRSLDYNANGVFDLTTDTYTIIAGVLEITDINGDWIRQEIVSATKTDFTVSISVSSGAPAENGTIFYNEADAQAYMNTL